MTDRIYLPGLRAALRRRYGTAPELACSQQPNDDFPRSQTAAWDCDHRSALRIAPPEIWNRSPNRYGTRELIDDVGNKWWVTDRANGTYHVGVHTLLEGDWKYTKKADQQAARTANKIWKRLRRMP